MEPACTAATPAVAIEIAVESYEEKCHASHKNRTSGYIRLGAVYGVLSGHRVADEVDLMRAGDTGNVRDLLHHFFVDMQPSGGVDNHDVTIIFPGEVDCVTRDSYGVFFALFVSAYHDL